MLKTMNVDSRTGLATILAAAFLILGVLLFIGGSDDSDADVLTDGDETTIVTGTQTVTYKVISASNETCEVSYFTSSDNGDITIPESVTIKGVDVTVIGLGVGCADEGTVGTITLPDTIEYIGDCAFQNASFFSINLDSLTNLTTLGVGAFAYVGIDGPDKILTIPASVTNIGTRAFGTTTYDNINEGVQLAEGNTAFKIANSMLLSMDGTRLLRVNDTGNILTVPATVTNIDSSAFEPSAYKMIVIEGTPTIVDESETVQFNSGDYMFYNYLGTKPMVVAVSSADMTSVAGNGYEVANISPISHGSLGYFIDDGKYYLSFSPESGYYLQNWTKNGSYVDPSEELEIIDGDVISATVNAIPEDQELDIDDGVQLVRYKVISFEDATCKAIYFESDGALTIPSQVNLFGFDMMVIGLGEYCADEGVFGAVTLPDTIEFIDKFAFQNATVDSINLTSLTKLTEIKDGGFAYLEITGATKTLTIPASVTSIGTRAFGTSTYANINQGVNVASGNTAFKVADGMLLSMDGKRLLRVNSTEGAVIVPASVETIDDNAFEKSNHTMVVIKGTPTIATDGATVPFNSDLNYLFTAYGAEKPIVVAESNTDLANLAGKGYAVANVLPNANGTFSYSFDGGKAYVSFAPASGYIAKNWVKNGADVALSDKLEIANGDTVSMAVEADPDSGDDKKNSNLVLYAAIAAVAVIGALAAVYFLFLRPKA
ncbi:MAG: hypothetical protein E7Z63_07140 [Thermoplasmata archaeon]|nr:hypothetical protein [Thermoplasmata archaeon]